jgi:3-isopropylmalate/(R)-2-methylmalate dehydratase small subunit
MAKYQDLIAGEDSLLATTATAWVLGDHVTQRQILEPQHLALSADDASRYVLTTVRTGFATRVGRGDFLVAGVDFAGDATHHIIPAALRALGIAAVIARSFGAFFLRSALQSGLPALVVEETGAIAMGDSLRVDVEANIVANLSSGDRYVIRNIDDAALGLLRAVAVANSGRGQ